MNNTDVLGHADLLFEDDGTKVWSAPLVIAGRTLLMSLLADDESATFSATTDPRLQPMATAFFADGASLDCPVILRGGGGADNYRAMYSVFEIPGSETLSAVKVDVYYRDNQRASRTWTRPAPD